MALVSPASAAPTNAKNAEIFELDCPGLGTVEIAVAPGMGEWTPGVATDNSVTLVPFRFVFDISVWFDGTKGPEPPDDTQSEVTTKHQLPRNGRTATCTFTEEGFDPADGVYFMVTGTVEGTHPPAH